jgi:tetratricopeptide (TPR) repeat protein
MPSTYKFNPGFQSDEESIQNFIVRKDDLERALAPLRAESDASPRVMIIAPRGAGKTTLCRRVLAEVNWDATLRERWHPVFFGEESYAITTPGEFFLECLFHLQDRSDDGQIKAAYDRALSHQTEKELIDLALKTLRAFSKRVGKRLLVIVENFQTILDDQIGSGAKDLLKRLSDAELFGVLATSVSQLSTEENVALPADFLRLDLRPLSLEECQALWNALTRQDVKSDRIRPLEILTGGSPRLLHILAEFMRSPSLHSLMENLNFLIDQNTEYFKSQLDSLPPTERKIFAALLEAWDPVTARQLAEAARVTTNIASAMLARLSERGAVVKITGYGKATLYAGAERLFNIYYLMRRRSHPSSRVRALVAFMTDYYDRDELIDTATTLAREACDIRPDSRMDYHATYDAILARAPTLRPSILERTPPDFLTSFTAHQKATAESAKARATLPASETKGADHELEKLLAQAAEAAELEETDEAIKLYEQATQLRPDTPAAWMRLAVLCLNEERAEDAIKAAKVVIRLRPKNPWGHTIQGLAHLSAGDPNAAEIAFETALRFDPDYGLAISELAAIKDEKGEHDAAIQLYERALHLDALTDGARARYARILQDEKRVEEAEELLRAVANDTEQFNSRRALVELLTDNDRQQEGIDLLRHAAENSKDWRPWADLGSFLFARLSNENEAAAALEKSIELGADDSLVFVSYAQALQRDGAPAARVIEVAKDLITRLHGSRDAWTDAGFLAMSAGDKALAETNFRKAIDLKEDAQGWLALGVLFQTQPKRAGDAESAFRKAVELAQETRFCSPVRLLAEFLVHQGDEAAAHEAMAKWFNGEQPCYCCTVLEGDIAARSGNSEGAMNAYRNALELRQEGIHALTGLSRFVDRAEGEKLIAQAMAAGPSDHRCLLARARLRQDDPESQIADALEAISLSSSYAEAHLFLARVLLKKGEAERALKHLELGLKELPQQRELTPMFVDTAMVMAAAGLGEQVSAMLAKDEYGSTMEPLTVALRLKRGDSPIVAKEVLEVAIDIATSSATPQDANPIRGSTSVRPRN